MKQAQWKPTLDNAAETLTGQLLSAMRRDIRSGALAPGSRLPTHRELAHRLGVAVGTVTAAYAQATAQGLIEARVGRGSFSSLRPHHTPMPVGP